MQPHSKLPQTHFNRQYRSMEQWKFIPYRAPWFAGWWERLILLTKNAIKKVLGRSFVNSDTLHTIITEVESTLNNRPLTYISKDIADPQPLTMLTPSHQFCGKRLGASHNSKETTTTDNLTVKLDYSK